MKILPHGHAIRFLAIATLAIPLTAPAQTWTGATSNNWGTASNWNSGLPNSNAFLTFTSATGAGGLNLNNNLTSGSFNINAIDFNSGAAAFVIGDGTTTANSGNTFVLNGNVLNNSTSTQTINTPFSTTASRTFTTTAGGGNIILGGDISGTGGAIQKAGSGVLTITGNNSFTGGFSHQNGTVNINSATALGTGNFTIGATGVTTIDNTSGGALTLTTNNAVAFATNVFTYGGTQDLNLGTGAVTGTGGGITLNGNGKTLTFGGILTNTGNTNTSFSFYQNGGGSKLVLGGFSLNAGAGATANTIGGNADVTITGAVTGGGNATAAILAQGGTGKLALQGNNTSWSGALRTSNSGTIKLDGNTATFSGSNPLQLNMGGKIEYDNTTSSAARSVSFGALSAGAGEGTFQSTRTAAQDVTVTLASLGTRSAGAAINIVSSGGTNGVNNTIKITAQGAGFMNGGVYFNGADFAAMSAAGGSGGFVRALQYGTDTNTVAVNTITSGKHVKLTTTPAAQAGISLLTLNLSGNTDFTLSSGNLTISNSGLLKSGGGNSTISGGSGISQTTELVVRTDTASDLLTISNNITSSATQAFTKSGAGTVVLTGTNSFTGTNPTLTINNGAVRAADGTGLPTGAILQLRGGVFESSGTFTRTVGTAAGNVNWSTASGGFAAQGGTLNLRLNGGNSSITWNAGSMVSDGRELIFGSATADNVVDFQNALNLGSGTVQPRTIRVLDNTNSTADRARISGAITNTTAGMSIIKEGAGVLEFTSNSNTYSGGTVVNAGSLLVNNTSGSGTGTGAVSVNAGAVLGGNGTISGNVTVNSGGTLSPGNSPGVLTVGSLLLNAGSTTALEINGVTTRGTDFDGINITTASGLTYGGNLTFSFGNSLANASTLDLFNFTGSAGGTFANVISTGAYAGPWSFSSGTWSFSDSFQTLSFNQANGDLFVVAVPEPSAAWMVAAAAGIGVLTLRRRRRA